ncbi:MAG: type I restriction enzyme HsdR N-terminal domain-containing protein [Bacteroidales bacterium]|jgi:hypothetical protein|nr:type I restriction enzyme HsdR N-terminal domain-containing protein [Bacteroidales bacterium]MDD2322214.1 type I restriction enzyme HsdR N-terminal domain-containing protein [Bacteroidales bacterium]MDD3009798.1 type I restriction enzyme HsdR N-terminal domain-containing protein [Bacteroidales bacterium]MDD3960308.1 type I restriction enzyme HsdR N-terminal domain-containing protein [Bacteroidales bacterium]MDY0284743.1 type I restriction enzyme HsdR N-terminal domain-containing protein [Bac
MTNFGALNLPTFEAKLKNTKSGPEIFDPVRKKFVALTPEEWVRQHVINLLIFYQGVPAGLIAVEKSFMYNSRIYRADIIVYTNTLNPLLLVECKAPAATLSQRTYEQAFKYNLVMKVPYLWITNGIKNFISEITYLPPQNRFLDYVPNYEEMTRFMTK